MQKYFIRNKCEILRDCVGALIDLSLPNSVLDKANALIEECDNIISDGYSFEVIHKANGDIDYSFSAPNKKKWQ